MKKNFIIRIGIAALSLFAAFAITGCKDDDTTTSSNAPSTSVEAGVKGDSTYLIEYVYEKVNGGQEILVREMSGVAGTAVTAEAFDSIGYAFDETNEGNVLAGEVQADGSLTLRRHYKLLQYAVNVTPTQNATVNVTADSELSSVKFGETVQVAVSVANGYVLDGLTVTTAEGAAVQILDGTFTMPNSAVRVMANVHKQDDSVYTVQHYVKALDGNGYDLYKEERLPAKEGTVVEAIALTTLGVTEESGNAEKVASGTVKQDGSLILKLYYLRSSFMLSKAGDSVDLLINGSATTATHPFGERVEVTATEEARAGYHYVLTLNGSDVGVEKLTETKFTVTMPGRVSEVKLTEVANDNTLYTVEHYVQNFDNEEAYTLYNRARYAMTTGETVTASAMAIAGFEEDVDHLLTKKEGTVAGDGSTVLRVYYTRESYVVTFLGATGEKVDEKTVKFGGAVPEVPATSLVNAVTAEYYYWSANGKYYDTHATVSDYMTVEMKTYDGVIATKEHFYTLFGAERQGESNTYISKDTIYGAYLLLSDIDFGGDTIRLGSFAGYLEGNGYTISNFATQQPTHEVQAATEFCGLFMTMSGVMRNLNVKNATYTVWNHPYMMPFKSATNKGGILAGTLSGTLENVYLQGSMMGSPGSRIYWTYPETWSEWDFPSLDAYGQIARAGYLAYDASEATLRNVVLDVNNLYRGGLDEDVEYIGDIERNHEELAFRLGIISGVGMFKAENVYVIASDETLERNATKNLTPEEMNVKFDEYENLSSEIAALGVWDSDFARTKNCVITPISGEYTVKYVFNDENDNKLFEHSVTSEGVVGVKTTVAPNMVAGYTLVSCEQTEITKDGTAVAVVTYQKEAERLVESFETWTTEDKVSINSSTSWNFIANFRSPTVSKAGTSERDTQWGMTFRHVAASGDYAAHVYAYQGNATFNFGLTNAQWAALNVEGATLSFKLAIQSRGASNGYLEALTIGGTENYKINGEDRTITASNPIEYKTSNPEFMTIEISAEEVAKMDTSNPYLYIYMHTDYDNVAEGSAPYMLWIDDVTVTLPEETTIGSVVVNHYGIDSTGEITLLKKELKSGTIGQTTTIAATTFSGYTAQTASKEVTYSDTPQTAYIWYTK